MSSHIAANLSKLVAFGSLTSSSSLWLITFVELANNARLKHLSYPPLVKLPKSVNNSKYVINPNTTERFVRVRRSQ